MRSTYLRHWAPLAARRLPGRRQGDDVYRPHLDRLAIPISFIRGVDDACVHVEGTESAVAELRARNGDGLYTLHAVPGSGDLDCLVGNVFPLVLEHLESSAPAAVVAG